MPNYEEFLSYLRENNYTEGFIRGFEETARIVVFPTFYYIRTKYEIPSLDQTSYVVNYSIIQVPDTTFMINYALLGISRGSSSFKIGDFMWYKDTTQEEKDNVELEILKGLRSNYLKKIFKLSDVVHSILHL